MSRSNSCINVNYMVMLVEGYVPTDTSNKDPLSLSSWMSFLLWTLQNSLMSVKMGEKDFILIK
jgi:hypothetical protein